MTIARNKNHEYEVTCDICGDTESYEDCRDFQELRHAMKKDNWKASNNNGEWEHTCEACVDKENESPEPDFI